MRNVWARYDAEDSGSKVFTSLVAALNRLVTEKPALLGSNSQVSGVGVFAQFPEGGSGSSSAYGLDVGGVAGMVASAASATVSNVVGMMGSEAGLSAQNSAMKLQWLVRYSCFLLKRSNRHVPRPLQHRPARQGRGASHT